MDTTNLFRLDGRVALVTGGSRGIGRMIAAGFVAQGARVYVSSRKAAACEETAAALGPNCIALPQDVATVDGCRALAAAVAEREERLDILVNNAGVTRDNLVMRMKDEEWDTVIRVNLEAAFRLARAAARPVMKARFGRIVSITSVVGTTGNPGQANYAASKAGLVGMSKALAQELASRGITVNCVAPGFITSPMTDALSDAQKDALNARIPAGKMGEGADNGAADVYLASKEAGYVTGQTMHVSGGMAMI